MIATVIVSIFLSIFSTVVLSYIALATGMGPWIAPTLVLIALLIYKTWCNSQSSIAQSTALTIGASSIGGILATALGFSYPAIYFLDNALFNEWMAQPVLFVGILAMCAFAGAECGLMLADLAEPQLVEKEQLPFPIGQMVHTMIAASASLRSAYQLLYGVCSAVVFYVFQDGLFSIPALIPRGITLLKSHAFGPFILPTVLLDMSPLLWAIGFVTGHVIAIPLAVGALSRYLVVDPLNRYAFAQIDNNQFMLVFGTGMVLIGAIIGLLDLPSFIRKTIIYAKNWRGSLYTGSTFLSGSVTVNSMCTIIHRIFVLAVTFFLFAYFGMSLWSIVFVLVATFICSYQMVVIAGKTGLAYLGRWATFVMIPAILLFRINALQAAIVSTFVELVGGVATDVLFNRKLAYLQNISRTKMRCFQYLGILVSSITVGVTFLLLINRFGLGSDQLFAYRAQTRYLLINAIESNGLSQFDLWVVLAGALFGYVLRYIRINPMMVLGGLLMPLQVSIGLIAGGLSTKLWKDPESWYPFWSGIFAIGSIWMLCKAFL